MSAGVFSRSKYEADNGDIHPIRVQPETFTVSSGSTSNDPPDGAIDNPISAKVSNGSRAIGIKPRSITFLFAGTAPTGYKVLSYIRLPILQPSLWSLFAPGDTFTYLGQTATVVGKNPERTR